MSSFDRLMPIQGEFNFDVQRTDDPDPLLAWREQRRREFAALACRLGLPLGQKVEVWLKDGIRLRGRLDLREEALVTEGVAVTNTEFHVDGTAFTYAEMESCVRL